MLDGGIEMEKPRKPAAEPEPKEPYSTPKLTIYGTVEEVTKAIGAHAQPDGGSFPTNRTHF